MLNVTIGASWRIVQNSDTPLPNSGIMCHVRDAVKPRGDLGDVWDLGEKRILRPWSYLGKRRLGAFFV